MGSEQTKIAIVTGAGTGVGRAASLALLNDGFRVVLAGRRPAPLQAVVAESGAGDRALAVPTNVADEASVAALFQTCVDHFGRVDVVFNNAGTNVRGVLLEDLELAQWQQVVDVNLTGMFLCVREAFRVMKRQQPQGGRIINNGSISAHVPRPNSAPYTATKHGVAGLTKSAALDGRKYDIAVSQIDIGNAITPMTDNKNMYEGAMQANGQRMVEPYMDAAIVGQSVRYIANLPLDANVLYHTVMATKMPFVGRG